MSIEYYLSIVITVLLSLFVIKLRSLKYKTKYNNTSNVRNKLIIIIIIYTVTTAIWFQLKSIYFLIVCSIAVTIFLPYLKKSSRYRKQCFDITSKINNNSIHRNWSDKLVRTSIVYLLGAIFALYCNHYQIATLCFATYISSTLYHLNKESKYFNLDNIFATAILILVIWSMIQAHQQSHETYCILLALGLPVSLFLIIYCGEPADIVIINSLTCDCIRYDRDIYNYYHTLWHFASGFGPFLATYYFTYLDGQSTLSQDCNNSRVPYVALLISAAINIAGNYYGIMPLD